jgi:hypothetical protein
MLDVLPPVPACCCVCLPCPGIVPVLGVSPYSSLCVPPPPQLLPVNGTRDNLISKVTRLWSGQRGFDSLRRPDRSEVHPVSPAQWVGWGYFSRGGGSAARFRMCGNILPVPSLHGVIIYHRELLLILLVVNSIP